MTGTHDNPFPYAGARVLLNGGTINDARKANTGLGASNEVTNILVQAAANAADAATVLLFGNASQQQEVHAWMNRNRQSR